MRIIIKTCIKYFNRNQLLSCFAKVLKYYSVFQQNSKTHDHRRKKNNHTLKEKYKINRGYSLSILSILHLLLSIDCYGKSVCQMHEIALKKACDDYNRGSLNRNFTFGDKVHTSKMKMCAT